MCLPASVSPWRRQKAEVVSNALVRTAGVGLETGDRGASGSMRPGWVLTFPDQDCRPSEQIVDSV